MSKLTIMFGIITAINSVIAAHSALVLAYWPLAIFAGIGAMVSAWCTWKCP